MPELPEVQTVVDHLNQLPLVGRAITAARVYWPRTIAGMSADRFCETVSGRTIRQITRRGKYIVFRLSNGMTLLIHLRMTGRLNWTPTDELRGNHEHVTLELENKNELRFQDTRKFGRIYLTGTPETILAKLGPEPLDASLSDDCFEKMLQARRRQIKPLLLDQTFLAGLGNIYVDEALWEAGIHPRRHGASLRRGEITALRRAIIHVLRKGMENRGTSLGNGKGNFHSVGNRPGNNAGALKVFRRTGAACPRCAAAIERIIVAQRSSHICPHCQKPPH
jgi:formamidopyrimidine-DNA glycosylase